mgnify:FL=1
MGEKQLITGIEGWVTREITLSTLVFPEVIDDDIGIDDMCLSDDVQDADEMYSQTLYWLDDVSIKRVDLVREESEVAKESETY